MAPRLITPFPWSVDYYNLYRTTPAYTPRVIQLSEPGDYAEWTFDLTSDQCDHIIAGDRVAGYGDPSGGYFYADARTGGLGDFEMTINGIKCNDFNAEVSDELIAGVFPTYWEFMNGSSLLWGISSFVKDLTFPLVGTNTFRITYRENVNFFVGNNGGPGGLGGYPLPYADGTMLIDCVFMGFIVPPGGSGFLGFTAWNGGVYDPTIGGRPTWYDSHVNPTFVDRSQYFSDTNRYSEPVLILNATNATLGTSTLDSTIICTDVRILTSPLVSPIFAEVDVEVTTPGVTGGVVMAYGTSGYFDGDYVARTEITGNTATLLIELVPGAGVYPFNTSADLMAVRSDWTVRPAAFLQSFGLTYGGDATHSWGDRIVNDVHPDPFSGRNFNYGRQPVYSIQIEQFNSQIIPTQDPSNEFSYTFDYTPHSPLSQMNFWSENSAPNSRLPGGPATAQNEDPTYHIFGDPVGLVWNFGDGNTSTSPMPVHTYVPNQPGMAGSITQGQFDPYEAAGDYNYIPQLSLLVPAVDPTLTDVQASGTAWVKNGYDAGNHLSIVVPFVYIKGWLKFSDLTLSNPAFEPFTDLGIPLSDKLDLASRPFQNAGFSPPMMVQKSGAVGYISAYEGITPHDIGYTSLGGTRLNTYLHGGAPYCFGRGGQNIWIASGSSLLYGPLGGPWPVQISFPTDPLRNGSSPGLSSIRYLASDSGRLFVLWDSQQSNGTQGGRLSNTPFVDVIDESSGQILKTLTFWILWGEEVQNGYLAVNKNVIFYAPDEDIGSIYKVDIDTETGMDARWVLLDDSIVGLETIGGSIPALRQRQRDDGLATNNGPRVASPGRNTPTSRQGSIRQGPKNTYL